MESCSFFCLKQLWPEEVWMDLMVSKPGGFFERAGVGMERAGSLISMEDHVGHAGVSL